MDAIQLRFMALVLKLLVSLLYQGQDGARLITAAREMIILLDARARVAE